MRLWLKFARANELAFISHLDTHKAFCRLMRRANIPLAYSRGFNPHPLLSLAAPLPVGFGSESDYVDVTLAETLCPDTLADALRTSSGSDKLKLRGLRVVPERTPALASLIKWGEYMVVLKATGGTNHAVSMEHSIDAAVSAFHAMPSCFFTKTTKRGSRVVDAKGLVHSLRRDGLTLWAVLSMAEPAVLRPEELVNLLSGEGQPQPIAFVLRRELYTAELIAPIHEGP